MRATSGSRIATARSNTVSVSASPVSHPSATPTRSGRAASGSHASSHPRVAASTSRRSAASRTVRASGPGASWLALMGTMPRVGTAPTVGLIPTTPLRAAGQVMEPFVSVPTASGTIPAATAAPEPDDDPPALRSSAQGLPVRPPTADQPLVDMGDRKFAHSDMFAAPIITAPASRSRRATGESRTTSRPASANDPAVPGSPTASMLSLMSTGMPCSGPRTWPCVRSASSSCASWGASVATARTDRKEMSVSGASMAVARSRALVTINSLDMLASVSANLRSCADIRAYSAERS